MKKEEKNFLEKIIKYDEGGRLERGTISPASLFNGLGEHKKDKLIHKLISFGYVEEVPTRVNDSMLNFYRASEKGINLFEVWYKRLWYNFKNNTTLYLAVVSIIFGLVSSTTSWYTVQNSIKANIISEQPLLIFLDLETKPYQFINSGKGAALNVFLTLWDKGGNQLYTTPEGSVLEAVSPGTEIIGHIDAGNLIKTNFSEMENKLPKIAKLFQAAKKENTSWFAIVYEDIYGRNYATLVRGPGTKEYTKAVEFIDFSHQ